jgi:hypothetical protein
MSHVITVGDVVKYILIAGGVVGVLAIIGYALAVVGAGFSK